MGYITRRVELLVKLALSNLWRDLISKFIPQGSRLYLCVYDIPEKLDFAPYSVKNIK